MLYVLDDDKFDAIANVYQCAFLLERSDHRFKYFKLEKEIDIEIKDLSVNDIVCFHNSFDSNTTSFIQRLLDENEKLNTFTLVCFSGDSSFYNLVEDRKYIKIHKDRFYHNLKQFVDSNFIIDTLLYGDYSNSKEISIIRNRINSMLFQYPKDEILPINELQPRDLKRLCELSKTEYNSFLGLIQGQTIHKFKSTVNIITQSC